MSLSAIRPKKRSTWLTQADHGPRATDEDIAQARGEREHLALITP